MNTHVEFRSSDFPPYAGEESEINPGCFGKRLAEFIQSALGSAGLEAERPAPEDWGWMISIRNDEFSLWVGCGNYAEYPDGFLCFIEPHQPYVRRWLKRVPTAPKIEIVREAIDKALRSHQGVRDIRWWTYEEFNAGD